MVKGSQTATVYLGLGSNLNAKKNISLGLDKLAELITDLRCSKVYESESVGFDGDNFLNMVVEGKTTMSIKALSDALKDIEDFSGRDRSSPKFSDRTLDIDILLYDDCIGDFDGVQLPRDEIKKNAFVLAPLAELANDLLYPNTSLTLGEMWKQFTKPEQKLWPVEFLWRGQKIS